MASSHIPDIPDSRFTSMSAGEDVTYFGAQGTFLVGKDQARPRPAHDWDNFGHDPCCDEGEMETDGDD